MKAAVFVEPGRILRDEELIPDVGPRDAFLRMITATICGIEEPGSSVEAHEEGGRVIAEAVSGNVPEDLPTVEAWGGRPIGSARDNPRQ